MRTSTPAVSPAFTTLAALAAACALAPGCTCTDLPKATPTDPPKATPTEQPKGTPINAAWSEDFDRAAIGPDWSVTDENAYRIENGELVVQRAYNHPLWLNRPLPHDATIEFDCWSNDDAGDLKVELWGDGHSHATARGQYTSTAYNFIFGGWHNQLSTLARLNEHGDDRKVRADIKVEKGKRYHFTIRRKGGHIDWLIDNQPFLAFDDPAPLDGPEHAHFAINNWEAELHFDHLRISPN